MTLIAEWNLCHMRHEQMIWLTYMHPARDFCAGISVQDLLLNCTSFSLTGQYPLPSYLLDRGWPFPSPLLVHYSASA